MAGITEETRAICRAASAADIKANMAYMRFCDRRDKMFEWAEYKRLRAIADRASEDAWAAVMKENRKR